MEAHSNSHLLNVIYIVPEHNIVSPFEEYVKVELYNDAVAMWDSDDDILFY
jgi:hypothetical protein